VITAISIENGNLPISVRVICTYEWPISNLTSFSTATMTWGCVCGTGHLTRPLYTPHITREWIQSLGRMIQKDSEKNPRQCHSVHHKSHWTDPGVNPATKHLMDLQFTSKNITERCWYHYQLLSSCLSCCLQWCTDQKFVWCDTNMPYCNIPKNVLCFYFIVVLIKCKNCSDIGMLCANKSMNFVNINSKNCRHNVSYSYSDN
jgi:hypothetical protein